MIVSTGMSTFEEIDRTYELLISHDIHFVMSSTDHVICLNGHICCSGSPSSVAKNPSYIELFGEHTASTLSLYKHHHDHSHGADGRIEK